MATRNARASNAGSAAGDAERPRRAASTKPGRTASAIEYAIALVAARSLPERKLREKLAARYDADETGRAIERMRELRLVDDEAWAERFVRDRHERSDNGRHRIRQELARRGIDKRAIDAAIELVLGCADERAKALRVLERMRTRLDRSGGAPETAKNRLFRRMVARGYSVDLVRDLLNVS